MKHLKIYENFLLEYQEISDSEYSNMRQEIPPKESLEIFQAYSMSTYQDINRFLKYGVSLNDRRHYIKPLDDLFVNKFKRDVILYRGITFLSDITAKEFTSDYRKREKVDPKTLIGKEFIEKSFMSTTISEETARGWSGHPGEGGYFIFKVKRGIPFANRKVLLGHDSPEKEILLPRELKYKINSIDIDPKSKRYRIYSEIL